MACLATMESLSTFRHDSGVDERFDWSLPAHVYTDASGFGMGAVITQKRIDEGTGGVLKSLFSTTP